MDVNSTRFLNHKEINSDGIDLLSDAYGIDSLYKDLSVVLDILKRRPDEKFLEQFISDLKDNF
ncbi:MAG: hypothetical protein K9J25_04960 [Bacteroidales bacterium]|nr:hypothetical protein [Bacteroidales bacterium]